MATTPTLPRLHAAVDARSPEGDQVPPHRHAQHELVLVVRGTLAVASAGRRLAGSAGIIYVFPAGSEHDQGCRGAWHTICALFDGDHPLLADGPRAFDTRGDLAVRSWMEQLRELGDDADDRATRDALLTALLFRLRRIERRLAAGRDQPRAVTLAVAAIEAQLDRDLDVARLAAALRVSPSHLGALCRAHLGCSPLRHHARLRMERARSLLANPYASVSEVARQLGYADLNWFVRRFRAAHGVPPGRWRLARTQAGPSA